MGLHFRQNYQEGSGIGQLWREAFSHHQLCLFTSSVINSLSRSPRLSPTSFPGRFFLTLEVGRENRPGNKVGPDLSGLVLCSQLECFYAFLRSTSSLWCTRTMRASVKIHLAPLRDLIKKPELLWYNVLLFFYLLRDRSLFIALGGRGKDLGLNKVKFSRSPL